MRVIHFIGHFLRHFLRHFLGAALLCVVSFPALADNDRELRTGPFDSYVVFGNGDQDAVAFLTRGSTAPTLVPLPKAHWVLDALIDDQQRLWVALGAVPREGPIELWRFAGAKVDHFTVAGTSAGQEAQLLATSSTVYLATPAGLWNVGGPSPQKLTSWQPDSYGFYAASLAKSPHGWLLLAPTFNTCSSSDHLEDLRVFEQGPAGRVERRTIPLPDGSLERAWLGADGWRYGVGCSGDVGLIGHHGGGKSWPVLHREPAPDCRYDFKQDGRFTIVMLGKTLLRIDEGRVERLGSADKTAAAIAAFYPDRRGRAVVLHADGKVVRYSSQKPPEVLGHFATLAR